MKSQIVYIISEALTKIINNSELPDIKLDNTKSKDHGDFACNVAMILAKTLKQNPRSIAEQIIANLPESEIITKVEIAGPGFINFFINQNSRSKIIKDILEQTDQFGQQPTNNKTISLEFVSANPTGPLHVGHGRGAAYGDSLKNLLKLSGYNVHCEYYVNDAGRQMDILATSVWLRYLDLISDENKPRFPDNGYKGDYIWDISATLHREHNDTFSINSQELYKNIIDDEAQGGDKELHIDQLIAKAKSYLGTKYKIIFDLALKTITTNIRNDLSNFRVEFDDWFAESSLISDNTLDKTIKTLEENGTIYQKNNTKWFKSTDYGDEKDRVVVRSNGIKTYFASDIAYHKNKIDRGVHKIINIWGADHHGYIPRVKAGMQALGLDSSKLEVLLVQFAHLFRNKEKVPMSTRSGSFVTLKQLFTEVGVDAARFFYVMRKPDQHLDFDLDLAKSQNSENPVFYIQYAHARIHSVMNQLSQNMISNDINNGLENLNLLTTEPEIDLINKLNQYNETLLRASQSFAPHIIAQYLRELANCFHSIYNSTKFIVDDLELRNARVCLILACAQIIKNGLEILGVSAPKQM